MTKRTRSSIRTAQTAVDLFSGCGGLTLGLKQAGFRVLGAIEVNELAVETYQKNHPDVTVWNRDIRKVTAQSILNALGLKKGELGLLAGCPPCQGFSSLRTLNGALTEPDGDMNDLVLQFMRFVRVLKPQNIMLENVPGLEKDPRFATLRRGLLVLGYKVIHAVLDASDFGVPQRRKRLILMASLHHTPRFAPKARRRPTVRTTIAKLPRPGKSSDDLHDLPELRAEHVKRLIHEVPRNGGSRAQLPSEFILGCHQRCNGFSDVYGRMAWDAVSPTITGGCVNPSKGRFLHPSQDRAITLREAALLQSFPKDYYFSLRKGKYAVAQMIGNALPPEFIRRNAKSFLPHD